LLKDSLDDEYTLANATIKEKVQIKSKYEDEKAEGDKSDSKIKKLEKQLEKAKAEYKSVSTALPTHDVNKVRKIKQCASYEGDLCICTGKVYFGEKFDRTLRDIKGSEHDLQALNFSQMLKYPYLTLKNKDQALYHCTFSTFYQGTAL